MSYPLLQRPVEPGFNRALCRPEPGGQRVALPLQRVGNARVERAASWSQTRPGHRAGRSRSPAAGTLERAPEPGMSCHPLWSSQRGAMCRRHAGAVRTGGRTRTLNRRLWGPLLCPVELHPRAEKQNAARSGFPGGRRSRRLLRLCAPPVPVGLLAVGQVDRSPRAGHANETGRRVPLRFPGGRPQHHGNCSFTAVVYIRRYGGRTAWCNEFLVTVPVRPGNRRRRPRCRTGPAAVMSGGWTANVRLRRSTVDGVEAVAGLEPA